jgi:hypothetical protein
LSPEEVRQLATICRKLAHHEEEMS